MQNPNTKIKYEVTTAIAYVSGGTTTSPMYDDYDKAVERYNETKLKYRGEYKRLMKYEVTETINGNTTTYKIHTQQILKES